jgi:4'-phosphopantetheinyl transferase
MDTDLWQRPPEQLQLAPHEVHLWQASLEAQPEEMTFLAGVLSKDEIERAERFHFQKDHDRFIVARGTLRCILSRYLNQPPATIVFAYTHYGKPFLQSAQADPIRFNLSHAHQLALYALSHTREVGVDVEYVRFQKDTGKIIARFFSESEKMEFQRLPECLRTKAFFSGWTRKEAFVKAHGEGLSFPFEKFSVCLHPDQSGGWVDIAPDKKDGREWRVRDIPVPAAYCAAVAVADPDLHFRFWDCAGLAV